MERIPTFQTAKCSAMPGSAGKETWIGIGQEFVNWRSCFFNVEPKLIQMMGRDVCVCFLGKPHIPSFFPSSRRSNWEASRFYPRAPTISSEGFRRWLDPKSTHPSHRTETEVGQEPTRVNSYTPSSTRHS